MLTEQEVIKLMSLPHTGSIYSWDNQKVSCILPVHDDDIHVDRVGSQTFGASREVTWWASWIDGSHAYLFTAPICETVQRKTEYSCGQISGHDHDHLWMEEE